MTPSPEPVLTFEAMLDNLKRAPNWQHLPDIRVAMWPSQVSFADDLSDATLFNDRYMESRAFVGKMAFALYLTCGAFLATAIFSVIAITCDMLTNRDWREIVSLNWMLTLFSILMFFLAYGLFKLEPICVRFNRQAQLVHIYQRPGEAMTSLWREVHPFTKFSPSGEGQLSLKLIFRTSPTDLAMAPGAFDLGDESALVDNLTRLEFLRRYMAEGLSAIQPDPQRTANPPSGFTRSVTFKDDGLIDFLLAKLVVLPAYYLAGGPLIDRYLLRRAANLQWPAEVEQLCSPGADLSGYDTTPVQAHPDIFYRFNGRGFDLVDIHGNVLG